MSAVLTRRRSPRGDIADYVEALVFVYFVLIIANIILSWVQQFRPIPYNLTLRAVLGFIEDTTNPYLNLFRGLRAADRPARHQPDHRHHRALRRRRHRRRPDPRVSSPRGRAWLGMLAVCGLVVVARPGVKAAIVAPMEPGERTDLALGFELARVTNSGIAFGLFSDGSDALVLAVHRPPPWR